MKIITLLWYQTSKDGHTTVRAGLPYFCMGNCGAPKDIEFYQDGKLIKRILGQYEGCNCAMSEDGYFVTLGFLTGKPKFEQYLTLYSPTGEEIMQRIIEMKGAIHKLRVPKGAEYIAVNGGMAEPSKLRIYNKKGEKICDYDTKSGFEKFNFWCETKYFILCADYFTFFKLPNFIPTWKTIEVNPDIYEVDDENGYIIGIDQQMFRFNYETNQDEYKYKIENNRFSLKFKNEIYKFQISR